jgi:hypothetical protein
MIPWYGWLALGLTIGPSAAAILWGRDWWPASHYPMFSSRLRPRDVVVIRIALESANGEWRWWRPRFFRLQDRLAARFAAVAPSLTGTPEAAEFLRLCADAEALISRDVPNADVAALRFVRRRVSGSAGQFEADDTVVARVAVPRR